MGSRGNVVLVAGGASGMCSSTRRTACTAALLLLAASGPELAAQPRPQRGPPPATPVVELRGPPRPTGPALPAKIDYVPIERFDQVRGLLVSTNSVGISPFTFLLIKVRRPDKPLRRDSAAR